MNKNAISFPTKKLENFQFGPEFDTWVTMFAHYFVAGSWKQLNKKNIFLFFKRTAIEWKEKYCHSRTSVSLFYQRIFCWLVGIHLCTVDVFKRQFAINGDRKESVIQLYRVIEVDDKKPYHLKMKPALVFLLAIGFVAGVSISMRSWIGQIENIGKSLHDGFVRERDVSRQTFYWSDGTHSKSHCICDTSRPNKLKPFFKIISPNCEKT